jgi:transcriptional regulator with XRE-family HTH domain
MRSLAEIVRAARVERGLSKAQFCAATGLSGTTLAMVEYGGRASRVTIDKLAAFLDVPASELDPSGAALQRRGSGRRGRPPVKEAT